jgi:hypothetical protein
MNENNKNFITHKSEINATMAFTQSLHARLRKQQPKVYGGIIKDQKRKDDLISLP